MNDRAAYQLIGLGAGLMGVGVLNLAVNRYGAYRFRRHVAETVESNPEQVSQMRAKMIAEENDDGRSSAYD